MAGNHPNREYLPIPANLTPIERICFCIAIPKDSEHLAAFWGALDALSQSYSWGKPRSVDSFTVAAYWQDIIQTARECYERSLFMSNNGCGCDTDPLFRFTAEGVREVSHDDGETWEVDPTDPRVIGSIIPPPLWLLPPGGHECEGAITGAGNMHTMMDEILTTGATGLSVMYETIAQIICIMSVGTACIAAELIAAAAVLIVNLTSEYVDGVLTDAVYDQFQCILFCHINGDATFNSAGWQAVKDDIDDEITQPDARFILWNMVNALGPAGLSNLCRMSIAPTGNCDDCDCEDCGVGVHLAESGTDLTDLGGGVWRVTSTLDGDGNSVASVWVHENETGCCNVVDQTTEEFIAHGQVFDCSGAFSNTGWPIPSGCYKLVSWYNTAAEGAFAFTVTFKLIPCP